MKSKSAAHVLTLPHPLLQCDDPLSFYSIFASIPSGGLHYATAGASPPVQVAWRFTTNLDLRYSIRSLRFFF